MREELLKGLNEEQIAKIKACKDNEEIIRLAKNEGIELTDEQLEAVSGGGCGQDGLVCPFCGQSDYYWRMTNGTLEIYVCNGCSNTFYCNSDTGEVRKTR